MNKFFSTRKRNLLFSNTKCRMLLIFTIPFFLFFSHLQTAQAHAYSASYTTLDLTKSQTKMTYVLDELSVMELTNGDQDHNGMLDQNEFEAVKSKIEVILKKHMILKIDGKPQEWSKQVEWNFDRKGEATQLQIVVDFPALTPGQSISLTDNLYKNDSNTNYVDLVKVNYGDHNSTSALSGNDRTWSMMLSENEYAGLLSSDSKSQAAPTESLNKQVESNKQSEKPAVSTSGWLTFLKLGMNHILTGYDHLLFLLSLLIARQTFKQYATVITAFTIAHSITLTLTVLGWIHVPPSIVEPMIALSICYVALENIFRKSISYRWVVTFLFGLIHGMGFADLLVEMDIPKNQLALDLASFNIGIEIIQLFIVILLLPLITLLYRWRHSKYAVITISTIAFLLGGIWLIERVFI